MIWHELTRPNDKIWDHRSDDRPGCHPAPAPRQATRARNDAWSPVACLLRTTPLYRPNAYDLPHIPRAFTSRPQWVLWQGADRVDKQTGEITGLEKMPINPQTLHKASTTNPATWGTFDQCMARSGRPGRWEYDHPGEYRGGGVGYVLPRMIPMPASTLTTAWTPRRTPLTPGHTRYVETLGSYTEITPSGTGLHILAQSTLPPGGRKKGGWNSTTRAASSRSRGGMCPAPPHHRTPARGRHASAQAGVWGAVPISPPVSNPAPVLLDDRAILEKARAAKNGAKFAALWAGDTSLYGGDESSADLALCDILAFWTQDATQIDRLFRDSGLMRDKWDARRGEQTYPAPEPSRRR